MAPDPHEQGRVWLRTDGVFPAYRQCGASDAQCAQLAAGPGAFPGLVETAGELPGARTCVMFGLAIETMAERTEVIAAGVAGDQGRGPVAVHRILDLAQDDHAGQ